jgi:hypothetical protein
MWVLRKELADAWWVGRTLIPCAAASILWPWLTFAALLIYRMSMRQARIRPAHVLRCTIYSADAALVVGPALLGVQFFTDPWGNVAFPGGWSAWNFVLNPETLLVLLAVVLLLTYRLAIAYRRYLRFPHAIAAVLASQVMVSLALLKLYLLWRGM